MKHLKLSEKGVVRQIYTFLASVDDLPENATDRQRNRVTRLLENNKRITFSNDRIIVHNEDLTEVTNAIAAEAQSLKDNGETALFIDGAISTIKAERIANMPKSYGEVSKRIFFKRMTALGKWKAFRTLIKQTEEVEDLYNNSGALDINDPDVIALAPAILVSLGLSDEEYQSLFEL